MPPKTRRSRSRSASEPAAREAGEEKAKANDEAMLDLADEDAKAGAAALLTPDAEALAAVCDSGDDDEEDQDDLLDTGDVTIREGSELATYIFVDLPLDAPLPAPGSSVTIRGLETASPSIEFSGGEEKKEKGKGKPSSSSFAAEGGEWKESVGSLLFVAKKPSSADAAAKESTPRPGSYLCHTERILSFTTKGS